MQPARLPAGNPHENGSHAQIARELAVSADGPLNIAQLAVDRHAASAIADKTAFRFPGEAGSRRDVSYRELLAHGRRRGTQGN